MTSCCPSMADPDADSLSTGRGVVVGVVDVVAVDVVAVVEAVDDFFFFVLPEKFV